MGADVDANEVDAATAVRCADWCISELIRATHKLSLEEAQAIVDAIADRQIPEVWSVAGRKRVLTPGRSKRDETLILLYSELETAVPVEDLAEWVEASRLDNYRRQVLLPLHAARLIEYDRETETVVLSPMGARAAELLLRTEEM